MELTEATQRILRHHLKLIIVLVVLGLAVPLALHTRHTDHYVATSRLLVETSDTPNAERADVLASNAQGIITSPEQVRKTLKAASVRRDAEKMARDDVKVVAIGTSGVLEVTVTDKDPKVAAQVANGLAEEFVAERRQREIGTSEQRLTEIDAQLSVLRTKISDIERSVRTTEPGAIQGLLLRHQNLLQQQGTLTDERQSLANTVTAPPGSSVLSPAEVPANPEPAKLPARLAIGALVGLMLGIGAAAIIEAMHPTIVNGDALSRALGAPVIGELRHRPDLAKVSNYPTLIHHLRLAARGAGVDVVRLAAVGPAVDLQALSSSISSSIGPYPEVSLADTATETGDGEEVFSAGNYGTALVRPQDLPSTGIVVVAPVVLKRDALTSLEHLVEMTHWPLIGIIGYRHSRSGRRPDTSVDVKPVAGAHSAAAQPHPVAESTVARP